MEPVNATLDALMASPWALALIFAVCALDAFLPVVPGETVVIAGAVLAASGEQNLLWVIVLAAAGSFVGDHLSYLLGRRLGGRAVGRLVRGRRSRVAGEWAESVLRTRGGLLLVAFRFIPGGRTASTLAAGALGYPLRRFTAFDALAAACWGTYAALLGYSTGGLFKHNALLAVGVGLGVSVALTLAVETVRRLRRGVLGRFPKFMAVGATNAVVDVGVFNLLLLAVPTPSAPQLVACNTVAVLAALLNSYVWNTRWTFRGQAACRGPGAWWQRATFALQAGANVMVNDVVLGALAALLSTSVVLSATASHNIAKLLAMLAASLVSFLAMRFVVFRNVVPEGGGSR
ncbi:MAG: VTT domain-containing protein [Streptosporangiaceae bacterium]